MEDKRGWNKQRFGLLWFNFRRRSEKFRISFPCELASAIWATANNEHMKWGKFSYRSYKKFNGGKQKHDFDRLS